MIHRFVDAVGDKDEVAVTRTDRTLGFHELQVIDNRFEIFGSDQYDGKLGDGAGLHEGEGFIEFVHGAHTSGHDDEGIGILYEQHFAHEEMFEGDGCIHIRIHFLFERQLNIATDGAAAILESPAVGSFHDPRSAARHCIETQQSDPLADLACHLVIRMVFFEAGRSENGDGGADEVEGTETLDKLAKNPEGEKQFIATGFGPFQENMFFRRNNRLKRSHFNNFDQTERQFK